MRRVAVRNLGAVLKGLGELAGEDFAEILQKLSIDAFRELVMRSAKDTGFLRSNWDVSINSPNEEELRNASGSNFTAASWPGIRITADDKVTIYNNTAYAGYLEDGTPWMRAQPMIEPTFQRIYNQAEELSKFLTRERYDV
jgi:HK97 gp10 family phage protein